MTLQQLEENASVSRLKGERRWLAKDGRARRLTLIIDFKAIYDLLDLRGQAHRWHRREVFSNCLSRCRSR